MKLPPPVGRRAVASPPGPPIFSLRGKIKRGAGCEPEGTEVFDGAQREGAQPQAGIPRQRNKATQWPQPIPPSRPFFCREPVEWQ
jgi:hypothetical protein